MTPQLLIVVCCRSWMKWLSPFLSEIDQPNRVVLSDVDDDIDGDALYRDLVEAPEAHILIISHHDTLRRDARVAEAVRLQTKKSVFANSKVVAELAFDKAAMSMLAHDIEGLQIIKTLSWDAALAALERGNGHVIVKPHNQTEGRDCVIFSDVLSFSQSGLADAMANGRVLAQSFISGVEYSVNAIAGPAGVQIYEPVSKSANSVRDWQHPANRKRQSPDPNTPRTVVDRLVNVSNAYLQRLNTMGVVELEFIVDENQQVWFVELNPRLAATTRMSSLVSQRNLFVDLAQAAMGEPVCQGLVPTQGFSQEIKLTGSQLDALDVADFQFPEFSFSSRATVWGQTIECLDRNVARLHETLPRGLS